MRAAANSETTGVFIHAYYVDVVYELIEYLKNFESPFVTYISTDTTEKQLMISSAFQSSGLKCETVIKTFPNIGRDYAPFLIAFKDELLSHRVGVRLHTKKSSHAPEAWGAAWRRHLLTELVGSSSRISHAIEQFERHPDLGVLVAVHWPEISHWISSGANYHLLQGLLQRIGLNLAEDEHIEFPSGSMFWFRSEALRPLLDLNWSPDDFQQSHGEDRDATLAHAVERVILFAASAAGYGWGVLDPIRREIDLPPEVALPLLSDSGLFDRNYYLAVNIDVAKAGVDPLWHYYFYGFKEGRNPSERFETRFYERLMAQHVGDTNPLLHYMLRGRQLGLPTTSWLLMPDRSKPVHADILHKLEWIASTANEMK